MDKELIESMRNKSREERLAFFKEHKNELIDDALQAVNGGAGGYGRNPNSEECPYAGCWWSSRGFICNDQVVCP